MSDYMARMLEYYKTDLNSYYVRDMNITKQRWMTLFIKMRTILHPLETYNELQNTRDASSLSLATLLEAIISFIVYSQGKLTNNNIYYGKTTIYKEREL